MYITSILSAWVSCSMYSGDIGVSDREIGILQLTDGYRPAGEVSVAPAPVVMRGQLIAIEQGRAA